MLNSLGSSEEQKSKLINLNEPSSASIVHHHEKINIIAEGKIGGPKIKRNEIGENAIIEEQNEDEDEEL